MAKYNQKFELDVEDMELIETALRQTKTKLAVETMGQSTSRAICERTAKDMEGTARRIHDLLGRLHNQKVFFRPKSQPYIGG